MPHRVSEIQYLVMTLIMNALQLWRQEFQISWIKDVCPAGKVCLCDAWCLATCRRRYSTFLVKKDTFLWQVHLCFFKWLLPGSCSGSWSIVRDPGRGELGPACRWGSQMIHINSRTRFFTHLIWGEKLFILESSMRRVGVGGTHLLWLWPRVGTGAAAAACTWLFSPPAI